MRTRDAGTGAQDQVVLRLSNALILSIALHAGVLALLGLSRYLGGAVQNLEPLLDVDVVSLPPAPAAPKPAPALPVAPAAVEKPPEARTLPNAQIVAPSDAGKEEPPKETRLLSDRNNTVEQQTVRRGDPEAGPPAAPKPPEAPRRPAKPEVAAKPQPRPGAPATKPEAQQQQLARAPGLDALLPNAAQMAREGYAGSDAEEPTADSEAPPQERRELLRYADRGGHGGQRGTFDFLPDVREGDVTLLNTKAELFAPFVRRVAQRVFQNQIIFLRRDLSRVAVSAKESVTVEAVMNRRGQMTSVRITDQSATSSTGLDRHLLRSCQQAFFDLNPPPDAVSADGNIHFIFRTEVQIVASPSGVANYGALLMAGLL